MEAKPYKIPHPFRKLNLELINKIVVDISKGSPIVFACEANGITSRIFHIWRRQGRIDIEHDEDTLCAHFVRSLAKECQNETQLCRQYIRDNEKGHKGAEWTLEHAYFRHYGANSAMQDLIEEMEDLAMDGRDEKIGKVFESVKKEKESKRKNENEK